MSRACGDPEHVHTGASTLRVTLRVFPKVIPGILRDSTRSMPSCCDVFSTDPRLLTSISLDLTWSYTRLFAIAIGLHTVQTRIHTSHAHMYIHAHVRTHIHTYRTYWANHGSFIHSLTTEIYVAPLQGYCSEALPTLT